MSRPEVRNLWHWPPWQTREPERPVEPRPAARPPRRPAWMEAPAVAAPPLDSRPDRQPDGQVTRDPHPVLWPVSCLDARDHRLCLDSQVVRVADAAGLPEGAGHAGLPRGTVSMVVDLTTFWVTWHLIGDTHCFELTRSHEVFALDRPHARDRR